MLLMVVRSLTGRGRFETYLACLSFSAIGVTELAHILVFPIIIGRPLGYFPRAASMLLLAPAA
ncbi:hypothetical protein GCM10007989_38000 [Devosia pacifica]|uniref:Uncharacterized protein n=1 Tax=Devosia pacifica TaxID=1335967 RepID=A0A918VZH3_9HYPH|nr:hypothetical protein GCM10007989_38000 [Devosia pacifica]